MEAHYESSPHNSPLAWVEACVRLSRRKRLALEASNLGAVEACLEEEGRLLEQRPEFGPGAMDKSLITELKAINATNAALVRNGLEFSSVLLEAIRPQATYGVNGEIRRASTNDAVLSVQG